MQWDIVQTNFLISKEGQVSLYSVMLKITDAQAFTEAPQGHDKATIIQ